MRKANMLMAKDGEIETMMEHEKSISFSFGVGRDEAVCDACSVEWM